MSSCTKMKSKYIRDDHMHIGKNMKKIKKNINTILYYIYTCIPLDYRTMTQIYSDTDNLDFECESEYDSGMEWNPTGNAKTNDFCNNDETDREYYYLDDNCTELDTTYGVYNYRLINEIRTYLKNHSTKDLKLKNVAKIKLLNTVGINHNKRGTTPLDWKLHFWPEYAVCRHLHNEISFHDLIVAAYKIRSHKFENLYEHYEHGQVVNLKEGKYGFCIEFNAAMKHMS